ncbi:uncharacterized protein BJ212DRAFT_1304578 [Suillus subaureus]|uniref:Uncharacterized protein n=1 Tax=Suillus subaureus TaxID=48587 RepID=A0A9P7DUF1_9AGAM|nr:uncharacterized protein BJ212DRAFT_1304578 [Suillus subaureus]KAG1803429.1 hypothetical protein BJ212DRAFT_1304578 [Suillus subaureus]
MSPQSAVQFNGPLVTDYNSMDVDESTVSWASLDDPYLGPDDDIEYDSPSSGSPDVLAAIPNQSPLAQADHPGFLIDPDLYLGLEDDIIDVDELPDSADPKIDVPAASEASMSLDDTSNELQSEQPELTNEDLCLMAWEFRPFGSYEHTGWIFLILPFHCYSRLSDPSGWLGQKLPTNSEELMQTSRGCKEPNG